MNYDVEKRDKLIFGDKIPTYPGGCESFEEMSTETLNELIRLDFIELDECQNFSPTVKQFSELMNKYPGIFYAHGYAVSAARSDYRVTLEGIGSNCILDGNMMRDFEDLCRNADEYSCDRTGCYCWFD